MCSRNSSYLSAAIRRKVVRIPIAILSFCVIVFFVFIGKAYQNNALSLHFVDEEEYIVLANYILKGDQLYSDIFTNHQPVTYIFSAAVQNISNPNSIFLLIKRHREAVILWSLVWCLLITVRFGKWFLPVVFLFEISKIYLLGNLFLAESISVYPLMYLVILAVRQKKITPLELSIVGIFSGLIIFLLAPLWPLVAILMTLIIINQGKRPKNIFCISLGILIIMLVISKFISWPEYFYNAIYTNYKYFLPIASHDPLYTTFVKALLSPIIAFFPVDYPSQTLWIIRCMSVLLIINLLLLIKKQKFYLALIIVLILGLSNIRFIQPGLQYYQGFHLLPWFATLITVTVFTIPLLWKNIFFNKMATLAIFIWFVAFMVSVYFSSETLFKKKNMTNEWFINYSRQFSMGEAVRIMKGQGDVLFIAPDEWLVYWQAGIPHASKVPGFYAWMYSVPGLNSTVHNMFQTNPPPFFYVNDKNVTLKKYFDKYIEIKKDGGDTGLFVLPEKVKLLSGEQKNKLIYLGFNLD